MTLSVLAQTVAHCRGAEVRLEEVRDVVAGWRVKDGLAEIQEAATTQNQMDEWEVQIARKMEAEEHDTPCGAV